eukprot:UN31416
MNAKKEETIKFLTDNVDELYKKVEDLNSELKDLKLCFQTAYEDCIPELHDLLEKIDGLQWFEDEVVSRVRIECEKKKRSRTIDAISSPPENVLTEDDMRGDSTDSEVSEQEKKDVASPLKLKEPTTQIK